MARIGRRARLVGVGRLQGRALRADRCGRAGSSRISTRCSTRKERAPVLRAGHRGAGGRSERPSVNDGVRAPGHRLEGGCEVGVAGEAGHVRAGAHAGPAHHQRNVDVGLVARSACLPACGADRGGSRCPTRTRCRCCRAVRSRAACARDGRRRGRRPAASGSGLRYRRSMAVRLERAERREIAHEGGHAARRRPGRSSACAARARAGTTRRRAGAGTAGWCGAYTER